MDKQTDALFKSRRRSSFQDAPDAYKVQKIVTIEIGDRIRFSTELLELIEQNDKCSQLVVVKDIKTDPNDGSKIVMLGNECIPD